MNRCTESSLLQIAQPQPKYIGDSPFFKGIILMEAEINKEDFLIAYKHLIDKQHHTKLNNEYNEAGVIEHSNELWKMFNSEQRKDFIEFCLK